MRQQPDFLQNLRTEFANGRQWMDRVVVMVFAVLAGLSIVGFTLLADATFGLYQAGRETLWWAPLVWTPAMTALIVWAVQRWAPGIAGSGVPQVLVALAPETPLASRGRFTSLRLSMLKILGVSGSLLAGLSVGRQGPSVQIGAGVMLAARRWLSPDSDISARELLVAGGAVGLAAAFNTPLGGIVFAIEELSRKLQDRSSGLMLAAIVVGGLVSVSAFGSLSYFGRVKAENLTWWTLIGPALVVSVFAGLLGGLMSRLLLASFTGHAGPLLCETYRQLPDQPAFLAPVLFGRVLRVRWSRLVIAVVVTRGRPMARGHRLTTLPAPLVPHPCHSAWPPCGSDARRASTLVDRLPRLHRHGHRVARSCHARYLVGSRPGHGVPVRQSCPW